HTHLEHPNSQAPAQKIPPFLKPPAYAKHNVIIDGRRGLRPCKRRSGQPGILAKPVSQPGLSLCTREAARVRFGSDVTSATTRGPRLATPICLRYVRVLLGLHCPIIGSICRSQRWRTRTPSEYQVCLQKCRLRRWSPSLGFCLLVR